MTGRNNPLPPLCPLLMLILFCTHGIRNLISSNIWSYFKFLDAEITKLTTIIGQKSRDVITLGKKFFYKQIDENIKTAYK